MKEFPALKMTKVEDAELHFEWGTLAYRVPAVWEVTAATGNIYTITGSEYSRFQYTRKWWWHREGNGAGPFETRRDCLAAINQRELQRESEALATQ